MLLLDIGNSRVKAARANPTLAQIEALPATAHDGVIDMALAAYDEAGRTGPVWVSHVLGPEREVQIAHAIQSRWNQAPRFARTSSNLGDLRNAYREPERLGVDRWLVMLAAWQTERRALVVVDAGTALTADVVDASGQHQGGFIAAGLQTAQRAVLGATRFATRDLHAVFDGGLGRDTEACVRQGAMLACLGAVDRAATIAGPGASRWITGGDAETLLPYLSGNWQHRPMLVLEGLLAMARSMNP